ncbi:hypothetical protein HMPREF3173_09175 [Pseudomonas sp. HMSC08G10]|uniref:hypothetical protein n=1 Tax=Pseudomonas sp. HMSC08G10 TaxID=1581141 RepID=UPI0008A4E59D|nr:hypothetical protein [Pseudomonas sp. HMSC08G10]OFS74239.1 hypothetical protein HMPREF3173_09175 [Pseudomonas sp. HMSC08G10]
MNSEFRCQNEACAATFKGRIIQETGSDDLFVICPECGAKHIAVEKLGLPGGPDTYRFRLVDGPSDGGG